MSSEKQGLQSTKLSPPHSDEDFFPEPAKPNIKLKEVCYALYESNDVVGYMDLTGRFPKVSSSGNQCILVGYNYDGNCIDVIPTKNRKGLIIAEAWQQMHNKFLKAGAAPSIYVLDNETSRDLTAAFDENHVHYQFVAPCKHRNNIAERAIQTFKSHFKSGLAATDPNFPLAEWDRLILQAIIALNLLRSAAGDPASS